MPESAWRGKALIPTRRFRLSGGPASTDVWATLVLHEGGGRLRPEVLWIHNEPVEEVEFRWEEVESIRVKRYILRPGVQWVLRRPDVEGNPGRRFAFLTIRRRSAARILDYAGSSGAALGKRVMPPYAR